MKKLAALFALLFPLLFTSCKKKEAHHSYASISKGDLMVLVVSDSLEYAVEYKKDNFPSAILNESPTHATAEFYDGYYNVSIYTYGVGLYVGYRQNVVGGNWVLEFPVFMPFYSDTFIDSIPGKELYQHSVYHVPLDTSKIDYVMYPYENELEGAWSKIENLKILHEYRMNFPASKIAFLHVKKEDGEGKSYFFINKYKP